MPVCNEGVAADHTRPKNTLSAKPTPYTTPVHYHLLSAGGNESSIKRRYQCVTSSEFSLFPPLSLSLSLSLSLASCPFFFPYTSVSLARTIFFPFYTSLSLSLSSFLHSFSPFLSLSLSLSLSFFSFFFLFFRIPLLVFVTCPLPFFGRR